MSTTIDSAGRIVIPKAIGEELGLGGGENVEIALADGTIAITVPRAPMHLEGAGRAAYAVPDRPLPPLTQELVRRTLERVRR